MTILNDADDIWLGTSTVDAVYLGETEVWRKWDPTRLTGLTIWLDASQLTQANGAYIDTWPSLVGSLVGTNYNVVPYRPVMRTGALNGLPVVRFSPGGGLRWPDHGIDLTWTVIYVSRLWQTNPCRVVSAGYPPANIVLGYHGGFEDKAYVESWLLPDVSHTNTYDWHLYTGAGDGGPGTAKAWFYSNGVFLSGDHAVSGGWKGTFQLNGYSPTSGEETGYPEVAEVCFYNRRLPDPERQQVEGYLREKWGLP